LAAEIAGNDLDNRSGVALKLADGSGLYLSLLDEKLFFQWRPLLVRRTRK
jgi:hypothetical protein